MSLQATATPAPTAPGNHPFCSPLQTLAAFLGEHPDAPGILNAPFDGSGTMVELFTCLESADELREVAQQLGGRWDKRANGEHFELLHDLGNGARIRYSASREQVCERVVVGTEFVEVPDPDAPTITQQRDVVEWRCPESLLALTGEGASS